MKLGAIVVAMVGLGCVRTHAEQCGDLVCPEGTTCTAYADFTLCVTPEQLADCEGRAEGDACGADASSGFCRGGACLPIGCGNGRIDDLVFSTDEECDDGNRISHDGCSSTCRDEVPRVDELYPFGLFPLTEAALATDTAAAEALLFGGSEYGAAVTARTWRFVDDQWRRIPTRTGPSARRSHGVAYDRRRQRLVMFGGANTDSRFADTWEFDGTAWHAREVMHAPPPRQNHAMAYDPVRGVTVMFGGRMLSNPGDTWEWDGIDWRERIDAMPAPITRAHQSMAFDPGRGVMVMIVEGNIELDTYELADDGWHLVAPTGQGPLPGEKAPLAYDAVSRRIVASTASLSAWDGQAWTSITAPLDGRVNAAMTTNMDGRLLRVGGSGSDNVASTPVTQTWDGAMWIDRNGLDGAPVARVDFDAVYDRARQRVVLFGGRSSTSLGDTWELGNSGWTNVSVVGPSPRSGHAMAYDAKRKQTVLYGDVDGDRQTWLWDGTTWTPRPAVTGLDARSFAAMAYDAQREVVVLYGGVSSTGYFGDTWEWDGTTWTKRMPDDRPPQRADAALAYDPIREQLVLFGGRGSDADTRTLVYGDTWAWDGTTWTKLEPAGVPTSRFGHGLAWDPTRSRLVLVGGSQDPGLFADSATRDVWEWDGATWTGVDVMSPTTSGRIAATEGFASGALVFTSVINFVASMRIEWSADTAYETCTQADRDRDGLVGCADLDCWYVCTPSCEPNTTCPAGPRCGDGTCSPIEGCRACPADCGPCPDVCGDGSCGAGEDCVGDCTP